VGLGQEIETAKIIIRVAEDLQTLSSRAKGGDFKAHEALELAKEGIDNFLLDVGSSPEIIVIVPPEK